VFVVCCSQAGSTKAVFVCSSEDPCILIVHGYSALRLNILLLGVIKPVACSAGDRRMR
jgi:hypothetical protein